MSPPKRSTAAAASQAPVRARATADLGRRRQNFLWWIPAGVFLVWAILLVIRPSGVVLLLTTWPKATPEWSYFLGAAILAAFSIALHLMAVAAGGEEARKTARRGMYFLVIGEDGRVSTSKLQLVFWTYAIAFVFLSLVLQGIFDPETDLNEQYLLLLGIPTAGVAGAKLITTTKLASGTIEKSDVADSNVTINMAPPAEAEGVEVTPAPPLGETPPDGAATLGTALGQAVSDDQGRGDVGDFQYLIFNVVALVYFFTNFFASSGSELPTVPPTIIALTGASALAYLTKKGVVNDTPVITGVYPGRATEGEFVVVRGHHFASGAQRPGTKATRDVQVLIGGRLALNAHATTPTIVHAEVPPGAVGAQELAVVTAGGLQSHAFTFEVFERTPLIRTVSPTRVFLSSHRELTIRGKDFVTADGRSPTVNLNGVSLTLQPDASADKIVAVLPDDAKTKIGEGEWELVVMDDRGRPSVASKVEIVKET